MRTLAASVSVLMLAACASVSPPPAPATPAPVAAAAEVFFDDFSHANLSALLAQGWQVREKAGHPGIAGATWAPQGISLLDDPLQAKNRLLRLEARTDGTGPGTQQAQLCHQRKYLEGTYAARIRFSDVPVSGVDGDPIIQTFYAVSPLNGDFDPEFSELDWEYLANGGWASEKTRLYGITWQTVRLSPWKAYNQAHQEFVNLGAGDGWHVLMMQVAQGQVKWFLNGRQLVSHGGRNYPVAPMSINFNLWFSPGGLLPQSQQPRVYQQDVDWVFHARQQVLSPAQVEAEVKRLRAAGQTYRDTVPAAQPALVSSCDF